jgi:hypothetical protein
MLKPGQVGHKEHVSLECAPIFSQAIQETRLMLGTHVAFYDQKL